jgi:hypothetical protein
MRRAVAILLTVVMCVSLPAPALAYLKFGVTIGSEVVDVRWHEMPVRYFVTERDVAGVAADQLRAAVADAFATWRDVPDVDIRSEFLGFTTSAPNQVDGRTTLGFLDRPDLDRVLAATSFILDASTGEIVDSDLFFNTHFDWSTAAAGETGRIDVQSIAVHEIGHLLGLGHSAIGETEMVSADGRRVLASGAVMFPIAYGPGTVAGRTLLADDVAGAIDLYGTAGERASSISGRVTKDGRGLYGAHVVAFNPASGSSIGGFTLSETGSFVIAGLAPGLYVVRVEPLDDADPESFVSGIVDVDFAVTFAERLVVVPRNGTSRPVEIAVGRK